MSSSIIKEELKRFLNSHEKGIFAVRGKWGVGKTHLIREVISANKGGWGNRKVAFVSLFGVNSLEELREYIFVEIESESLSKNLKGAVKTLGSLAEGSGSTYGGIGSGLVKLGTQLWMRQVIPKSKIVIDDIERRGLDLSIRDLLGFLSQLKEQSECQVIVIFNVNELDDSTKLELERHREKVFDREIEFVPDVNEIITLGFPDALPSTVEVLQRLRVDNIRAVQKIKQFVSRLEPHIKSLSSIAQNEVLGSAIILAWFYFVRDRTSIPWDFVKGYEDNGWRVRRAMKRYRGSTEPDSEEDKIRESLSLRLEETGYIKTGPLENLLIDALESGFYEPTKFDAILQDLSEKIRQDEAHRALTNNVWSKFHSSFDDNQDEFVSSMLTCFREQGKYFGLSNLSEAVSLMEQLGLFEKAEELCNIYFDLHPTIDPDTLDFPFAFERNERVIARAKDHIAKQKKLANKALIDVLHGMVRQSGWDLRDIDLLGMYSENDWYVFFKEELKDVQFRRSYIRRLIDFEVLPEERYKLIGSEARAALEKIAAESLLNKVRVEGILSK